VSHRGEGVRRVVVGAVVCAAVLAIASGCRSSPRYDLVLLGGRIVDGTGNPWFYGDLAVRGARIVRVGPAGTMASAPARRKLVLRDAVIAPGFIDILSQSREAALVGDGRMVSKVTQGVTTEIFGEGITPAPANDKTGSPSSRGLGGSHGFAHWLSAMESRGLSVNVGSFVGATTVRRYAMAGKLGPPSAAELDTMRAVVRRAMEDGALGLASALEYPPGSFASTDELIELAKVTAPFGGVYATHLRSEGAALVEAVDEALSIGRSAGVPVEIYHLKAAGPENWSKLSVVLAKIDSARTSGEDVGADMYPYTAARTRLSVCLPPWASADGKLFDRLSDSSTRARIRVEMLDRRSANLCQLATPEGVIVSGFKRAEFQQYEGARLSTVAERLGASWADMVIDWTVQERGAVRGTFFLASENALPAEMRQPWMKFGTDAAGVDPERAHSLVHPRAYGTYPRVLGHFVREQKVLTLEEAIRKMTSAVAARLWIPDRGLLREGMYADLVIFDPGSIVDQATYTAPHRLSSGVRYVFVNGVEVVRDGIHTGARPGRIIRGPATAKRF
jgi:N-acyl-D-amino-acid deacylase